MRPLFDQVLEVLDRLDQFLAELSRYPFDKRDFTLHDYNRQVPAGARGVPGPIPVDPILPKPPPIPPDPGRKERIF
jgi:hypothetical protein